MPPPSLIRHVVKLAAEEGEPCGIIGVPARASIVNKELLLDIAHGIMSSVMVVSEPFMVAYSMDKLSNAIVVDIGGGTIDICGMKGTVPTVDDQVTFLKGGDFLDERLQGAISHQYPETQVTVNLARMIKESYGFVGPVEEPVRVTLRAEGRPNVYDVTEEVRTVCESIVPEIVEHLAAIFRGMTRKTSPRCCRILFWPVAVHGFVALTGCWRTICVSTARPTSSRLMILILPAVWGR